MKKILVTGGAGFLGSHLCEKLLHNGNYVLCMDNFHTGSLKNLSKFIDHPNFEILNHDVTQSIPNIKVDQIYNLACPASPVHYQSDAIKTIKTNVYGAFNLMELALASDAKILQASTSEVYGDPEIHPQPESYWGRVNSIGIRACYDEGKRCAESIFFDFYRKYNLDIKVVRIFNTYGPHMHPNDGRVVSNFIVQAIFGQPITIYGDGLQTRSFCYVKDLVDALVLMMDSPQGIVGPVNLGNPQEFSMYELAALIVRLTGSKSTIEYKDLPADDPRQRQPDIALAKELLGWSPMTALEDGLIKTIAYFRKVLPEYKNT